jgi:hypothetical protein
MFAIAFAVAAACFGGAAWAQPPQPGAVNPRAVTFDLNAKVSPNAFSKTIRTPAGLHLSVDISMLDGSHPPALTELALRLDRGIAIDTEGLPSCSFGLQEASSRRVRYRAADSSLDECRPATLGEGEANFEIAFPEEAPIYVGSHLHVYNGGVHGGTRILWIYMPVSVPTPAAIISKVKLRKISDGRFGSEPVLEMAKMAGGSGSLTHFDFTLNRRFRRHGERTGVVTFRCPSGEFTIDGQAGFADGSGSAVETLRTCTGTSR